MIKGDEKERSFDQFQQSRNVCFADGVCKACRWGLQSSLMGFAKLAYPICQRLLIEAVKKRILTPFGICWIHVVLATHPFFPLFLTHLLYRITESSSRHGGCMLLQEMAQKLHVDSLPHLAQHPPNGFVH